LNAAATISASNFSRTSAVYYGGGLYAEHSRLSVAGTNFSHGLSGQKGGGMAIWGGSGNIMSTAFRSCTARAATDVEIDETSSGGGLMVYNARDTASYFDNLLFHDCAAVRGGGLLIELSTVYITGANFFDCSASSKGGGVYFTWSEGGISDSHFECCVAARSHIATTTAVDNDGGAIYVHTTLAPFNLTNSSFLRCAATRGGALAVEATAALTVALRYIQVSLARRTRPDQMPGWVHSGLVWVRPDGPGSGLVSRHARMNQMSGLARMRPDAGCPDVARAVSRMPRCPGNPDGARPALCPASPDASS
jgi:hypothetical protein